MLLRALDLYCAAGGATKGLQRAGFHVTGVDIKQSKRYCGDAFVLADALEYAADPLLIDAFDFIWASPPCQAYSSAAGKERKSGKIYPELIERTRALLDRSGVPYVIENVPRAPIRPDFVLHGDMFPELRVLRERWFEASWGPSLQLRSVPRDNLIQRHGYATVAGNGTQGWSYARGIKHLTADCRRAMGIDWMTRAELSQAIPPAYSEFIARAWLAQRAERAA